MSDTDDNPSIRLITAYSSNALLDDVQEGLSLEFEPVCPKNGWSMNEIWRHAYISPPPGWWIMHDSGPCRNNYDYGEPAGYPTPTDPHSSLPNDWTVNDEGEIVVRDIHLRGRSQVRHRSRAKRLKGR